MATPSVQSPIVFSERPKCALCGSPQHDVHRAFRDIPVVRCRDCGFLYSSRIMETDVLNDYYRENFGGERHKRGQQVNARINATVLKSLLDNLKDVHNWLDIGTGYGFLMAWLKSAYGIETEGVELSIQEAEYAQ